MSSIQPPLFEIDAARSILDTLLSQSAIYRNGSDYKQLLDFVVRLRNFAPFNAMLLQIQKPGLQHAASAHDWATLFGRYPKEHARPLLIMWPFGPIALVYDVVDTEGAELPEDVASFLAKGPDVTHLFPEFISRLERQRIQWRSIDAGDGSAGEIRLVSSDIDGKGTHVYRLFINQNHPSQVQFTTLVHELAHLFLGHLSDDKKRGIPKRRPLPLATREVEAESVAFLVSARNGIRAKSQTYLSTFVKRGTTTDDIDLYQVMRAAGQIETLLGLSRPTRFPKPHPGG